MNRLLICLVILLPFFSSGQNLVPNGDFEEWDNCVTNLGQLDTLKNWFSATESPDHFNTCSIYHPLWGQASAPYNGLGFQYPFNGNGYAGFLTTSNVGNVNVREYMGVRLTQSLIVGTTYFFSARISSAFGNDQQFYTYSNNIGIRFSSIKHSNNQNPIVTNNFSHCNFDSILTDTTNWKLIQFSFIADSAYDYLYIGNFYDAVNTDTIQGLSTIGYGSYCYIDAICLTSNNNCSIVGIEYLSDSLVNILLYPNPVINILSIESKFPLRGNLFSVDMDLALEVKLNAGLNKLDLGNLSAGIYAFLFEDGRVYRIMKK